VNAEHRIEDLLRELAPQVLATLVRRHGQFAACEDAVTEQERSWEKAKEASDP
jgi:predicted RNA polymerase sigma factor